MQFVSPNQLTQVELYKSPNLGPLAKKCQPSSLPQDMKISGAAYTRIKGTGVGFKGIELQLLVTTPDELLIFRPDGSTIYRRPLTGMRIGKQALDAIRIVSRDQEKIDIVVGLAMRSRVMEHLYAAISAVSGVPLLADGVIAGSAAAAVVAGSGGNDRQALSAEDLKDIVEDVADVFQSEEDDEQTSDDYVDDSDF